jgi:TnpA family transposase
MAGGGGPETAEMDLERQYVDSHGQSEVPFCQLLGFELLPRLKAIASQRLYCLAAGMGEGGRSWRRSSPSPLTGC